VKQIYKDINFSQVTIIGTADSPPFGPIGAVAS
jgi:hypothetical protein